MRKTGIARISYGIVAIPVFFALSMLFSACNLFPQTSQKGKNMDCKYILYADTKIPMRDGVKLSADIYLPNRKGPFPVLMNRSPYGETSPGDAANGKYAVVWVDCRGRFDSEGKCEPWINEMNDGYDTLEWIAAQDWCDGNVCTAGGSYPGWTQIAAAMSGHPALKGIAPSAISENLFEVYYTHGVLRLTFMPSWHIGLCSRDIVLKKQPDWPAIQKMLPTANTDENAGMPCATWKKIATTVDPEDPFWQRAKILPQAKNIHAPFFIQTSYYDLLGRRGPEIFTALMNDPATPVSFKENSCMRIGPWGHGVNTPEGKIDFAPACMVQEEPEIAFRDALFAGKHPECYGKKERIEYFTMVENKWHAAETWPVPGAVDTPFYFSGKGEANTLKGDGELSRLPVKGNGAFDSYVYDPANPVPTCGGRIVHAGGQWNQMEVEMRPDVLVYTSPALADDLNVTGEVKVRLFVQSDAPDTDFTVKLVDVYPDGRPFNVCDTIYRMRYRNGYKKPVMMDGKSVYEVCFDVDYTSYLFLKGHCIRVEISSSNFPQYERNLNTEKLPALETEIHKANQKIHHSEKYPSCIILPVLGK